MSPYAPARPPRPLSPDSRLLTVAEVARLANCSPETVWRHVRKGALPVLRVGPALRIRVRLARERTRLVLDRLDVLEGSAMKLFGQIVRTIVNVAVLPVAVVKDVVTLGGVATENGEPYVVEALKKLKDEAGEK